MMLILARVFFLLAVILGAVAFFSPSEGGAMPIGKFLVSGVAVVSILLSAVLYIFMWLLEAE